MVKIAIKIEKARIKKIKIENQYFVVKKSKPKDIIIRCTESRLSKIFIMWMKENVEIKGSPYLIYIPGSVHDVVNGLFFIRIYWWYRIFTFAEKKNINKIAICNHEDCLIYGNETKEKQINDMRIVKAILNHIYKKLLIDIVFADLINKEEEKFDFRIIN